MESGTLPWNSFIFSRISERSQADAEIEDDEADGTVNREKRYLRIMSDEDDAMEIEPTAPAAVEESVSVAVVDEEDEEDVSELLEVLDDASAKPAITRIPLLLELLNDTEKCGPKAISLKERAIYDLTRAYCETSQYDEVVLMLKTSPFFSTVTKAKCAKTVRAVLDMVCNLAPAQLDMQADICKNIIEWTKREKRSFLRQRVEAKLASILLEQHQYGQALALIDPLLGELKKLDDKQLLVETHLLESKVHFGLRNVPKAKAALTASRTCANAIYVSPSLQASIDSMSGVLHTEEGDYDTAHSYFLEAFEQLDQMNDRERAVPCLKYMMLCRILDSLTKALQLSAQGGVGAYDKEYVCSHVITFLFFDSACRLISFYLQAPRVIGPKWTFLACSRDVKASSTRERTLKPCRPLRVPRRAVLSRNLRASLRPTPRNFRRTCLFVITCTFFKNSCWKAT